MEDDVVKVLERDVAHVALSSLALRLLYTERIVRALEGSGVAGLGQGAVDLGVLGRKAGLVEVVTVGELEVNDGRSRQPRPESSHVGHVRTVNSC